MRFLDPGSLAERSAAVVSAFERHHARPAMAMGWAPGRANLIGEHTDYNHGLALPIALPHTTQVAVATRSDARVNIVSRQEATSWDGELDLTGPGSVAGWPTYVAGVIWALRADGVDVPGLDVTIDSVVPMGSGLASSAALSCATALAVSEVVDLDLTDDLRRRLIRACVRAETEVAMAPTGSLDQTVALHARADHALLLDFSLDDDTGPRQVPLPFRDDSLVLLIIDTRVSHALNDGGFAARRADCEDAATELGVRSLRQVALEDLPRITDHRQRRRARHVVTENQRVLEVVRALRERNYPALGEHLRAGHASLREDFDVSTPELDTAVEAAMQAGALAARMTGGGFGGSVVALVASDRTDDLAHEIEAAFLRAGHRPPQLLLAQPSPGAGRISL